MTSRPRPSSANPSPEPVPFDASSPSLLAARARCSQACDDFNAIPEDAPAQVRNSAFLAILHPSYPSASSSPNASSSYQPPPTRRMAFATIVSPLSFGNSPQSGFQSPLDAAAVAAHQQLAPFVRSPVWMDYGVRVRIASTATVDRNCTILDTPVADVRIGEHVVIGPNVSIQAVTHPRGVRGDGGTRRTRASLGQRVVIDEFAWIGGGSIIMPNVVIGKHAVIGPGSVVTSDIPPSHVAAGNPARVVKRLPDDARSDENTSQPQNIVATLEEALMVGLGYQEQAEALGRVAEVAASINEWAEKRKAYWRQGWDHGE